MEAALSRNRPSADPTKSPQQLHTCVRLYHIPPLVPKHWHSDIPLSLILVSRLACACAAAAVICLAPLQHTRRGVFYVGLACLPTCFACLPAYLLCLAKIMRVVCSMYVGRSKESGQRTAKPCTYSICSIRTCAYRGSSVRNSAGHGEVAQTIAEHSFWEGMARGEPHSPHPHFNFATPVAMPILKIACSLTLNPHLTISPLPSPSPDPKPRSQAHRSSSGAVRRRRAPHSR